MATTFEHLGYYTLAGAAPEPRDLIAEARDGERLGLGWAFISERFNIKEAATLSGAVGAVSTTLQHRHRGDQPQHPPPDRHRVVRDDDAPPHRWPLHARARSWHRPADGGARAAAGDDGPAGGLRRVDAAAVARRDDPRPRRAGGRYPFLRLDPAFDEDIPLGITAFGPNTLRLAGRAFDQVVLHTFFEDETLARCVRTVKEAAEQAGRDPAAVKVWSCLATIGDHLPEPVRLKKTVGRMATYLQAYGDLMVSTNGWDPAPLARFRADPFVAGFQGAIDQNATTAELEHVATLIPESGWRRRRPGRPSSASRSCSGSSTSAPTA